MRFILSLIAMLALSACFGGDDSVPDRTPDYRYRLTVEVDTPEGLSTGSSVIEVRQGMGRTAADGFEQVLFVRAYGEAVAVDLPGGKTLYALLLSAGGDVNWATRVVPFLSPDEDDENPLDDVLLMEGKQELPRLWPPVGHLGERPAYPMMVIFGDEADPTSVALVDPDGLAASLGEGISLRRLTAELTDDEVTTGIEKRLEWLPNYYNKQLSGDRFQMLENKDKGVSAFISAGVFSAGVGVKDRRTEQ